MGQTVNIKWYLGQKGLLDMTESAALDFYLVLTGLRAAAVSTRSSTRPWQIDAVYLFHAADLLEQQHTRNIKIGVATSVLNSQWENAEIFPVLAAYLSAHRTMINGSVLCAALAVTERD